MLVAPLTVTSQFLGYAGNKAQSENKVLRDVVRPGDIYFNTGDLLLCDHRDFLYFCDRIGDTFRWAPLRRVVRGNVGYTTRCVTTESTVVNDDPHEKGKP